MESKKKRSWTDPAAPEAARITIQKILGYQKIAGFTLQTVGLFFLGGVQMMMLGIIGEYLWRILDEIRRRPVYVVDRLIEGAAVPRSGAARPHPSGPEGDPGPGPGDRR